MHRLSSIEVENFRSITLARFEFTGYTPLVGYNNAGKSNILRAIDWAVRKHSLKALDFNDVSRPVSVQFKVEFIDDETLSLIDEKHRDRISELVFNGEIDIRRTQDVPDAGTSGVRIEILDRRKADPAWVKPPTGIESAISALFPEPIVVGAMEDAAEDVAKFGSSTTIGKLLREISDAVRDRHSGPISEALEGISKQLSAGSPEKDEELKKLDRSIQEEISNFFPGISAEIHIPVPQFEDFMRSATIKMFEDAYKVDGGREPAAFGHGAQRTVQIALIKCLSDYRKESGGSAARCTLLLIDEPELYLHPQAVELVRASLSKLAESGYQVIFSTHSASMIDRLDAPVALLIRRNPKNGTVCLPRLGEAVRGAISDAEAQAGVLFDLSNSSQFLFSERVVLAEGKTERSILPTIYKQEIGRSLGEDRISLINIGGVNNIPGARKVLLSMGIATQSIVDFDFVSGSAVRAGIFSPEDDRLSKLRDICKKLSDDGEISISRVGWPANGVVTAAEAFEQLLMDPDALDPALSLINDCRKNGIWVWSRGAIEAHVGLTSKQSAAHAEFVRSYRNKEYRSKMPDHAGVRALCCWLQNAGEEINLS